MVPTRPTKRPSAGSSYWVQAARAQLGPRYNFAPVRFDPPLVQGRFLRRYKRFFADAEVDGRVEIAHCTNTGALTGCLVEGAPVGLRFVDRPGRKLRWTWTTVKLGRRWLGIDPNLATPLVAEAIQRRGRRLLPELDGYSRVISEVAYGRAGRSRIDLLLAEGGRRPAGKLSGREPWADERRLYLEVKNTTLMQRWRERTVAAFPDAVTERGKKHLLELMHVVEQGHRAAMVFVVQRSGCDLFRPAADVDPEYAATLSEARRAGVEVYAVAGPAGLSSIRLAQRLPIRE